MRAVLYMTCSRHARMGGEAGYKDILSLVVAPNSKGMAAPMSKEPVWVSWRCNTLGMRSPNGRCGRAEGQQGRRGEWRRERLGRTRWRCSARTGAASTWARRAASWPCWTARAASFWTCCGCACMPESRAAREKQGETSGSCRFLDVLRVRMHASRVQHERAGLWGTFVRMHADLCSMRGQGSGDTLFPGHAEACPPMCVI